MSTEYVLGSRSGGKKIMCRTITPPKTESRKVKHNLDFLQQPLVLRSKSDLRPRDAQALKVRDALGTIGRSVRYVVAKVPRAGRPDSAATGFVEPDQQPTTEGMVQRYGVRAAEPSAPSLEDWTGHAVEVLRDQVWAELVDASGHRLQALFDRAEFTPEQWDDVRAGRTFRFTRSRTSDGGALDEIRRLEVLRGTPVPQADIDAAREKMRVAREKNRAARAASA